MQNLHDWIQTLYLEPKLLGMGHAQSKQDLNLGLGWLYYSLVRIHRAKLVVVIGSYRGFTPMVFARALQDNQDSGKVIFIDPSLVDPFWTNPSDVQAHFAHFGLDNIEHHLNTTQEFVNTLAYQELNQIDLLFVDGYHSHEQAKFDHLAFKDKLTDQATVLFHDSTGHLSSGMYGESKRYQHTVIEYMDELKKQKGLQIFDLAYGSGVTLVKKTL